MNSISTHILDMTHGRPAASVRVQLFSSSQMLTENKTGPDGRIANLLPAGAAYETGQYRLVFFVRDYFPECFFPEVSIVFEIKDTAQHYHVPLLLSPFGYCTYRGS